MPSTLYWDSSVSYTLELTEKQEGNTFSPLPTKNLNSLKSHGWQNSQLFKTREDWKEFQMNHARPGQGTN